MGKEEVALVEDNNATTTVQVSNSDRFTVKRFHHVEFWCSDATNAARRFSFSLGMPIVSKSDLSTGNTTHASYLLRSGHLNFLFTAPYSPSIAQNLTTKTAATIPTFDYSACNSFTATHGLGVRSIAVEVDDARLAYTTSVQNGAKPSSPPILLGNGVVLAELKLYGDVLPRYISYNNSSPPENSFFLPGFEPFDEKSSDPSLDFGIRQLDHVVGAVPELDQAVKYVKGFTGFHEMAEFTAEDVGTNESGMNSVVLASNDAAVLLVVAEPVSGTKRRSQIQTYLEHNVGAGVQQLALSSQDIFGTLWEMRRRSGFGGFEFMPPPPLPSYYRNLKKRVGDVLSDEKIKECEDLGIMVDRDGEGTLLQIFTKPVGDRPTIFVEIIQRLGCMVNDTEGKSYQKSGCGGFGKGNIAELYKSVEEYEKTLEAIQINETPTVCE